MSILVASNAGRTDELVLNWKKVLGWKKDPFEPEKDNVHYFGGYDKEREALNLFILNEEKFGTIKGKEGVGKTMLAHWLTNNLSRHRTRFYTQLLRAEDLKDEKKAILKIGEPFKQEHPIKARFGKLNPKKVKRDNLKEYLHGNLKKRYLLIVEDAHELEKNQLKLLSSFIEADKTSLILTGRSRMSKLHLSSLSKDKLSLELRNLDFKGAKNMLIRRIEDAGGKGIWPFTDDQLKDLFSIVDYNPTKILHVCREKAKELAIEVKQDRIPPAKQESAPAHEYKWNQELKHPKVKEKKEKHGFGIKFTVKEEKHEERFKPEPLEDHAIHKDGEGQALSNQDKKKQTIHKQSLLRKEKQTTMEDHSIVIDFGIGDEKSKHKKSDHKKEKSKEIVIHLDGRTFSHAHHATGHADKHQSKHKQSKHEHHKQTVKQDSTHHSTSHGKDRGPDKRNHHMSHQTKQDKQMTKKSKHSKHKH